MPRPRFCMFCSSSRLFTEKAICAHQGATRTRTYFDLTFPTIAFTENPFLIKYFIYCQIGFFSRNDSSWKFSIDFILSLRYALQILLCIRTWNIKILITWVVKLYHKWMFPYVFSGQIARSTIFILFLLLNFVCLNQD